MGYMIVHLSSELSASLRDPSCDSFVRPLTIESACSSNCEILEDGLVTVRRLREWHHVG